MATGDLTEVKLDCPECGSAMRLKFSSRFNRHFYGCTSWAVTGCKGAIGAHPDGTPLGVPATQEIRTLRTETHAWFDAIWERDARESLGLSCESPPLMYRGQAYKWMQKSMGMTEKQAHIGNFGREECERLVGRIKAYLGIQS